MLTGSARHLSRGIGCEHLSSSPQGKFDFNLRCPVPVHYLSKCTRYLLYHSSMFSFWCSKRSRCEAFSLVYGGKLCKISTESSSSFPSPPHDLMKTSSLYPSLLRTDHSGGMDLPNVQGNYNSSYADGLVHVRMTDTKMLTRRLCANCRKENDNIFPLPRYCRKMSCTRFVVEYRRLHICYG